MPAAVDVFTHDMYFVVVHVHAILVLTILLLLLAAIYFVFARFGKPLNHRLGLSHFLLTILPVLFLTYHSVDQTSRHSPRYDSSAIDQWSATGTFLISLSTPTLVVGQLLLLVNIIRTVLGGRKRP